VRRRSRAHAPDDAHDLATWRQLISIARQQRDSIGPTAEHLRQTVFKLSLPAVNGLRSTPKGRAQWLTAGAQPVNRQLRAGLDLGDQPFFDGSDMSVDTARCCSGIAALDCGKRLPMLAEVSLWGALRLA
jgi:hypothetical protein